MPGVDQNHMLVRIRSGIHAGVTQSLPPGRYSIGSSASADLVLADADVAPLHMAIEIENGRLRLDALADGVVVGEHPLAKGESCAIERLSEVHLGSVELELAAHDAAETPPPAPIARGADRRFRSLHVWIGAAAVLAASGWALNEFGSDIAMRQSAIAAESPIGWTQIQPPSAEPAVQVALAQTPEAAAPQLTLKLPQAAWKSPMRQTPEPVDLDRAAEELGKRAADAGLIDVTATASGGVVTATGTVDPKALGRWQAEQQWFDERFAGRATLVNRVTVQPEALPSSIAIEAVWRGAEPHIIIRGQKHWVGGQVEGGWTIQRIEADKVVLSKAGRLVAMRY